MTMLLLKITVVLALGLAATSTLRRASAAVRHLVLAATFVALLAVPAAGWLLPPVSIPVPSSNAFPIAIVNSGVPARSNVQAPNEVVASTNRPRYSPSSVLYAVWTVGAVVGLCSLVIALARLARLRRTAVPWPHGQTLMDRIASDAGMRQTIEVARHEALGAPVTGGFGDPLVLLPREAEAWCEQDLRQAFLHELEHIHRRDWVVQVGARALCAIYWFHPLAWIACRRLCLEAERACDDAVVARVEGAAYAQQLLTLAQRVTTAEAVPMLSMAGRSDLSVRVRALLDATLPRGRAGRRAVVAAAIAVGLVVAALSPLRAAVAAADETTADEQAPRRPANPGAEAPRANAAQSAVATALAAGLIDAAERGDTADISALIAGGADVNAVVDGDGSALIVAARRNQLAMVRFLVERGADVNLAVEGDGNPLIMASARGALPVVQYLLDRGADIDAMVPGDENPLINASGNGHLDVVKLLVQRGANVNAGIWVDTYQPQDGGRPTVTREYRSPLSMALKAGHGAVADFLRANGATQ